MKPWFALFSQSGSEIVAISEAISRWPDFIFTDNKDKKSWHPKLQRHSSVFVEKHNKLPEFIQQNINMISTWRGEPIITLHGYLRIMPMLSVPMYNGHPGDIINYPELKGKDPQKKALKLGLSSTGCVIHEVTEEVDSGKIIAYNTYNIEHNETEAMLINNLRKLSIEMWTKVLEEKLVEELV